MELERDVERYLIGEVERRGGICIKCIPDHRSGMPDRIVMLPGGILIWVELKRPHGGRLSAVQQHRHRELNTLGQCVELCSTRAEVDALMMRIGV